MYTKFAYQKKWLLFLILLFSSCEKDDLKLELRSSENETLYWENNQTASKRFSTIMYSPSGTERFKVVHISDPHLSSYSYSNHYKNPFNLIQSVRFANQQELRINALVATGDFLSIDKKAQAMEYLKSFAFYFYKDNHIPSFLCTGNHDANTNGPAQTSYVSPSEINHLLFFDNRKKGRSASTNYYYADVANPQGGTIRLIALDMQDQPWNKHDPLIYVSYSQQQINWLGNVALKEGMTDRHSVILLTHYPFQPHSSDGSTYLIDGDFVHSWNMVPEIIEAFRNRESLTKNYPNQFDPTDHLQVDFDFADASGDFICYLGGHAHCTAYFDIKGLSNQGSKPLQKMILCTNQAPSEKGTIYNRVIREEDTLSSNSFCLYAIDTAEKNIYMTFFGAYKPRNVPDYPEIHVIPY